MKTDIIIVLDKSGSMQPIQKDTIGGVNKFIEEQKQVPGEANLSLFLFDHEYDRVADAIPIANVKPITTETYQPRGNTCLYGAIGTAIADTGNRLKSIPENQRPEKVIFVIVTDGEENSSYKHEWSKAHTAHTVKADIERQSGVYKWEFVYIEANQDAILSAHNLGIQTANAINYSSNAVGTQSLYDSLASNVRSMRTGQTANMSWDAKQRQAQKDAAKKP